MRVKDNTLIFYDLHRFERNEGSAISFPSCPFSSSFTWKRFNLFPLEAGVSLRSSTLFVLLFHTHTHTSPLIVGDIFFANMFLRHLCLVTSQLSSSLSAEIRTNELAARDYPPFFFLSRYYKPSLSFSAVLANDRDRED